MTHICVSKLAIIGSGNGLSPGRRQAIIWTNAGILLIGPLGTNFSEFLIIIHTFSFNKMHLKMSFAKWHPFCLCLNVLTDIKWDQGCQKNGPISNAHQHNYASSGSFPLSIMLTNKWSGHQQQQCWSIHNYDSQSLRLLTFQKFHFGVCEMQSMWPPFYFGVCGMQSIWPSFYFSVCGMQSMWPPFYFGVCGMQSIWLPFYFSVCGMPSMWPPFYFGVCGMQSIWPPFHFSVCGMQSMWPPFHFGVCGMK